MAATVKIALMNKGAFNAAEVYWTAVAAKGPQGLRGPQGYEGPQGPQGLPGQPASPGNPYNAITGYNPTTGILTMKTVSFNPATGSLEAD